ncbi:TIGR04168 family protein [Leptolyngbya iicbica]|uniref:TIGR04168 family protein n=2 Tax=Cyanophyceae TaxID=3028117 RepID=A0A4Q7E8A9_9CYAN|nr:TIGR04168 family protein [Leptolyngbya sp. LK]RZM78778.1 TIGR04168 family protein [Leptolyngbya sp. LK]
MIDIAAPNPSLQIAVIGDVHDQWDEQDIAALQSLKVDLVLFVGDFGNESVDVVRSIASLPLPKAAIFGNHDAWYTATPWGRRKCPYDRQSEDWVQQQIDLLGPADVSYSKRDFPELGVTVIGGRPFSWGGSEWKYEAFYRDRYGVHSFEESLARMKAAIDAAAFDTLIFVGHCGPTGLGDAPESPCGRDWKPLGGDFGDPDFAAAIAYAQRLGKSVPLVTFGHMHHHLRHRQDRLRQRVSRDSADTLYLNVACVPRIVQTATTCAHNFSLVTLTKQQVQRSHLVWVDQTHTITSTEDLLAELSPQKPLQPLS